MNGAVSTHAVSRDVSEEAAITITDLKTSFRREGHDFEVLKGISLKVDQGKTLAILGESGSGKSVTARSILRLHGRNTHHSGSIKIFGQEVIGKPESEVSKLRGTVMAYVPQDPNSSLDPLRRVHQQLSDTLRNQGLSRDQKRASVIDLLHLVGISDAPRVARSYPHELSGGMRQRIAIALAISRHPRLLIADEPTTALDPTIQLQILRLIQDLQKRLKMTVIFVTHDVDVAREISDDVAVMYSGRLVEHGPTTEVLASPRHAYTRALLAAVPTRTSIRGHLPTIAQSMAAEGIDAKVWSQT